MTLADSRTVAVAVALTFWTALAGGCGTGEPRAWGEPVDSTAAVPLAQLLSGENVETEEIVTTSGRIGEVCRTAGCWFVLQDEAGGRLHEVLIDLKPAATFTVTPDVQGRNAVVRGRLVGAKPDLKFHAVGLVLE